MGKILVIIPVYNREKLILRAIESVINQIYLDWECVVVDDCSTDSTRAVVQEFVEQDSRIRLVATPENGGNAAARNLGLRQVEPAKHEYVAFLDSDDAYLPHLLAASVDKLDKSPDEVGFSWVAPVKIYPSGEREPKKCWKPNSLFDNNPNHFFYELHIGTGKGLLLRAKCLTSDQMFDENIRTAVDTDFLVRLRQSWMYTYVDEVLIENYIQENSVRTDTRRKKEAYGYMLEKYSTIISQDPTLINKWYYKYFWLCLHSQDWAGAKRAARKITKHRLKVWSMYATFRFLPVEKAKTIHRRLS